MEGWEGVAQNEWCGGGIGIEGCVGDDGKEGWKGEEGFVEAWNQMER